MQSHRVAIIFGVLLLLLSATLSHAFVRMSENDRFAFWPNATTSLNLQVGCPSPPLLEWGPCWTDAVIDAANQWRDPSTAFHFTIEDPPSLTADPCKVDDAHTIAFRFLLCAGRDFGTALAVTIFYLNPATGEFVDADIIFAAGRPWTTYSGPQQTNAAGTTLFDFHRVVVHELGHVIGLGHPDEAGQQVVAIMNHTISDIETPQADDRAGVKAIYPATDPPAPIQGNLENPQPNRPVSGVGLISGWVCTASQIAVVVDGTITIIAPYGSPRADTESVCGRVNTGFGLLVNWSNLPPGPHEVVVLADGSEVGRAAVTVATFGTDFLRGASGTYVVPFNDRDVSLQWQESLQNFVISGVQ